jgi:aspartyl-tRNA(Asn)/glutamyl-tRNA(Gln) amidotransferase subunit C
MAKLTRDDILKLARLSRLRLSDNEIEKFQLEINEILAYVELLQKEDTDGIEPTYQVSGLQNVTRADEIYNYGYTSQDLLKNVPIKDGDYIKTKRIL